MEAIKKPTLLIDKQKCIANIKAMTNKANAANVRFRPHFKTHQSAEIGNWFKEDGVTAITVSSVEMANYFYLNGWKDITIAFPVNILEIEEINRIAMNISLNLLVDNEETTQFLIEKLTSKVGFYIKIDTGLNRVGLSAHNKSDILRIINLLQKNPYHQFKGFLSHAGQTYQAKTPEKIIEIYSNSMHIMNSLKKEFHSIAKNIEISIGDTPSCSLLENFEGADEIRPGNFVFYDVQQYFLGACKPNQIAVALACPIVSKNADRYEVVVYGGAIHLSKDFAMDKNGQKIYGLICKLTEKGWSEPFDNCYVSALSQEHGKIKVSEEIFESLKIGNILAILPAHSCLVSHKEIITI